MEEEAKIIITRGKADDNAEYVDLINYAFGFNGMESSFYKLLPKLFGKERNPAADTYFVKDEKGRLLACAGLFPLKMRVCGKCYKAYGIGNVAVHPAMRGKGYMKAVMKAATDFAINDGAIMLILSGKRTRYDHFGFEKCGTDACYTLTSKTLFDRDPNFSPSLTIKALTPDDALSLDNIYRLHSSEKRHFSFERKREDLYDILVSWQSTPYVFYGNEGFAGWAVVKGNEVNELVFGDVKYAKDMIYLLMRGRNYLSFHLPECDVQAADLLWYYAETVYVGADLCFNILNYERALSALMELKCSYETLSEGALVFEIDGFAKKERLEIRVENGKSRVTKTDGEADVKIGHLEAMQLFFTHKAPPSREKIKNPALRAWFPLPIYIYSPDNV